MLSAIVAGTESATIEETCRAKYPLKDTTINFVQETTGHNPLQYLYRRCITDAKKKEMEARQQERRQERMDLRTQLQIQQGSVLRKAVESTTKKNVARQQTARFRFRSQTEMQSIQKFVAERRSRRSIIRDAEGYDRVNAILRNLPNTDPAELCKDVKVISGVSNPCNR